jgi:hypothetical protein
MGLTHGRGSVGHGDPVDLLMATRLHVGGHRLRLGPRVVDRDHVLVTAVVLTPQRNCQYLWMGELQVGGAL